MNPDTLALLICPECSSADLRLDTYYSQGLAVQNGLLSCPACRSWYRIENGIVDLLPRSVANKPRRLAFARNHSLPYDEYESKVEKHKTEQMLFYSEGYQHYEEKVAQSPYFRALDEIYFKKWVHSNLAAGDRVLDVGCGTGRQTITLAQSGTRVIGLDVSEEMLLMAGDKLAQLGLSQFVDLIVADAETIPLRGLVFDACTMVGALHHLSAPERAIQNVADKIKTGGFFFSYDPHESAVRFIFDGIMRVLKLWDEEASEAPLFNEKKLDTLLKGAGIKSEFVISTYLLPHLFYLFNHSMNTKLLLKTDKIFGGVPIFRPLGGVIIAKGTKISTSNSDSNLQ